MEDRDFYNHHGIIGIIRAVIVDIINLSAKQGASTNSAISKNNV